MTKKQPDYNSQAKTARMLGVTKQAVQKRCKPGGDLHEATNDKKQVNYWHPKIQAWKAEIDDQSAETKPQPKEKKVKQKDDPQRHVGFSQDVSFEDVENLTIREVVERYGGTVGLMNYVKAMKEISDWKTKEDKLRKSRKELIERATVAKSLFTLFDVAFRRIVSEYPGTVTDQLFALAKSKKKTKRIDAIELQENTLSQILKGVKSEVIKGLEGSES